MRDKWNPTNTGILHRLDARGNRPHFCPHGKETTHLNPFRVEGPLKVYFRVFTDNKQAPQEMMTTKAPRTNTPKNRLIEVYTDGLCVNNGKTTTRVGGGI